MPDDRTKRKADRKFISIRQAHELRYWTKALGVTADRLREAIAAVGHSAAKVRAFMARDRFTK